MQVSRIGIGQMMFPGFNRSFGTDMTRNPYSWNRPGTPGYGSYGFPGYQGADSGGEVANAGGQCYTCSNRDTGETKSGISAALAAELDKKVWMCHRDHCVDVARGGYPAAFDFTGYGAMDPGVAADVAVSDFGGSAMMGRRGLGQVQPNAKPPLAVSYDDAKRMLASAEAIIAQYQSCELPVISRFRSYVATGAGVPALQLSADESAQLDQFQLCAQTKGVQGAASSDDTLGLVVAGLAAAALVGFMVWKG